MALNIEKVGEDLNDFPEKPLLCQNFLPMPRSQITLLYGEPGSGKSFLALRCAAELINNGERILYVSLEDNKDSFNKRCDVISSFYEFEKNKISVTYSKPKKDFFEDLKKELSIHFFDLVIIDTFSVFFSEMCKNIFVSTKTPDENDNGAVNFIMNEFKNLCDECHTAFLIIHHSNKGNTDIRGASSIKNSPRAVYKIISPTENTGFRHIEIDKENLGIKNSFIEQDIQILPVTDFDKKNIQKSETPIKTTLQQTELIKFNKGYISVNECRAILFLGAERIIGSNIYDVFMKNNKSITFVQKLESGYIETTIKNQILTQQHRTILDYILRDFSFKLKNTKLDGEEVQLSAILEPYKFLKKMGKNPRSYKWLKEKLYELGNFMYDIKIVLNGEKDNENIVFERRNMQILRTDILEQESDNSKNVKKNIIIYLRPEYSNMLKQQSLLDYSDRLYLIDQISNPIIQDLIRFLFTVQSKSIILSEFIKMRQYDKIASAPTITKLKKKLLEENPNLSENFGIDISPFGNDLLINFKRPKEIKFYSDKKDKYIYPTLKEPTLFDTAYDQD
jgi:hypothetical protein